MPLRIIYRRALSLEDVTVNPTTRLNLPAVEGRRVAAPAEIRALIDALPVAQRALWGTAFYAGLRRGELVALRIADVDLKTNVIHVRRSWDRREAEVDLKSARGLRDVPCRMLCAPT